MRELLHEVEQAIECAAGNAHRHMLPVKHDAVLRVIRIRRILQIPRLPSERQRHHAVVLPRREVAATAVAGILHAQHTLRIADAGRILQLRDFLRIFLRLGEIDGDFQPSRRRIGKITDVLRNRINLDVITRAAHLVEIFRRLLRMILRNALLEVRAYFLWRRREQPHQARTEEVARIRHILDDALFDRQIAQCPQKRRRGRRHVRHRHNIAGGGIKLKRIEQQVAEVRHIHRFYQPFCRCVNQQIFNCLCCIFFPRHHQHPFLYSSLRLDSLLIITENSFSVNQPGKRLDRKAKRQ